MKRGFLLDTNIPSEQIRPRPEPRIGQWLYAQSEDALFISAVTIGELRKGIVLLPASKRRTELEHWFEDDLIPTFTGHILPVTQEVSDRWGVLSAKRQLAGNMLSMADGLIAATAIEYGLTLATRNAKHFAGIGVTIVNPWDEQPLVSV